MERFNTLTIRDAFQPKGSVLEIACGTGIWTEQLAKHADSVVALDGAIEMLKINKAKLAAANVCYIEEDVFQWTPTQQFDVVFFSFWLSHVPRDEFKNFWTKVENSLLPDGRVFFVDSLPDPGSRAKDHPIADPSQDNQIRHLNDGRKFEIIKRYYDPSELHQQLEQLGWQPTINESGSFFLFGSAKRSSNTNE